MQRKLRTLTGLSVDELRHPSDRRATEALKKIPGLDKAMAKLLEVGLERLYYVDNIARPTAGPVPPQWTVARTSADWYQRRPFPAICARI